MVEGDTNVCADVLGHRVSGGYTCGGERESGIAAVEVVSVKRDADRQAKGKLAKGFRWPDTKLSYKACIKGDLVGDTAMQQEEGIQDSVAIRDFKVYDVLNLFGIVPGLIEQRELPVIDGIGEASPNVDLLNAAADCGRCVVIHIPPSADDRRPAAAEVEAKFEEWVEKRITE